MKYQKNIQIYIIFSKEEIKKMDLQKNKEYYIIRKKVKKRLKMNYIEITLKNLKIKRYV